MSAIGNDYGYDRVFSRELEAITKLGDVFIPITTSGNSSNILSAATAATAATAAIGQGVSNVGLTGDSGGKLRTVCPCICIPSSDTARIQECHIMLGHILCGLVESSYFQTDYST